MPNTIMARAQGRRAVVITLLIAGISLPSSSMLAGYGRVLKEPIQPSVMVQMAGATLNLLQGSIVHVDEFILEAAGTSSAYKAGGASRPPFLGYRNDSDLVRDFAFRPGEDGAYGFESLARTRAEMERQAEGLRQIISRYQAPMEVPLQEDRYEYELFLAEQLAEASEINMAIYWAVHGREYVVAWVLSSVVQSDELLAYQENANAGLRERRGLVLAANPEWARLGEMNLERLGEAEAEMEGPFAEAERDLIHAQVVRFMGLVNHTRTLMAQLGEQFDAFVDETPPEWGKLPLPYHLYDPLRYQITEKAPENPYLNAARMSLSVEFSFYPYSIVERGGYFWTLVTDHFDGVFGDGAGAVLTFDFPFCDHYEDWCHQRLVVDPLFEPGTPISPDEEEAPEYPQYVVVLPPTVPEVLLWGSALPGETTEDWSYLVPDDVIAEHGLDGNWVLMGIYGQSLFVVESRTADLSWPPADSHLEYRLLHTGAYNKEKANGREDVEWRGFWQGLRHHSSFGGVDSTTRLPADDADFYIVAVRLAEHTWAGRYEFKIGDLPVRWALPHARNRATTKFVRRLVAASEALDYADLFEPTPSIFKYDRFHVEIETTHDVETDDRIPFLLMVSRNGGPSEIVTFKTAGGEDSPTLYASRVGGNRRLFRSERMFVQDPAGANAWREGDGGREVGVALAAGDRLAARVVPHGVASQAALGMVAVHTAPANVGAAWKEAVIRAAALIHKSPPKPWDQLTTDEFNAMLRLPWGTVDSTPFVQARGRQIHLALGDLAAMLLIRDEFNKEMAKVLPALQILHNRARERPDALDLLRRDIRPDAGSPGTPLGEMAVTDPTVPFSTVPFRLVYDDAWLDRAFSSLIESQRASARAEWLDMVTVDAVARYNRAAVDTYRLSMGREIIGYRPDTSLDLANPEQMLRLTAIGMGRIAERIKPNLLRLVENPSAPVWDAFRWEVDPTARGYVGSIQALGVEFHNNEALVDQYNAITMVVAGGAGLLPKTVLGQGVALFVGVGSL
ncbi:hypothetical protein IIA16_02155, partial [bacterium]|nr:hypothetical protein [bacterium]